VGGPSAATPGGVMAHHAAFDVSGRETAIHVLIEHGKPVWRGKRPSEPEALAAALRRHDAELVRVGPETGRLAPWLYRSLKDLRLPIVCLDARHARAATALQRNKTDARDAETLAQLVRTGWYREARVKGWAAHAVRHLVGARAQPVGISTDLSNQLRSVLRTFGLRVTGRAGGAFEAKAREQIADRPEIAAAADPLLAAWRRAGGQLRCRRGGAGTLSAFALGGRPPRADARAAPVRGARPQRGRVQRGDKLLRTSLFEAAARLLVRVQRPPALKAWGLKLVQRLGFKRAAVSVARKIGVVLHAVWKGNKPSEARPTAAVAASTAA
jgi:transposase